MKKKDVLFLCQFFYPEYISSATLPYDTAMSLKESGYSVDVMCGYPKEYSLDNSVSLTEVHKGVNIKRLKYIQPKRSSSIGRIINYFSFTISVLLRFLKLKKYKSIIVYSNPPILPIVPAIASKLFKVKLVFVCYDVYPEIAEKTNVVNTKSLPSKLMRKVNKIVYKNLHTVVSLSNEMKKSLLQKRPDLEEKQVKVIPNWYADKGGLKNNPTLVNSKFEYLKDNFVVSYFGNMGTAQDLDTIVNAIRKLKNDNNIHFLFAGHGNKKELLTEIVYKEQIRNVTILDFLHNKEYQDALEISDCYIVSLAKGLTGLAVPSKTYSYMMAGKPIIAIIGKESDIARDLIDYNAGYALKPGEESNLVDAIMEMKGDVEKQKIMGDNCRQVFLKKYTKDICTKKYVKLMNEILGE